MHNDIFHISERLAVSLSAYIAAALTFVVGLAWNAAFQNMFKRVRWLQNWGPLAYAIIVTVIAFAAVTAAHRVLPHLKK